MKPSRTGVVIAGLATGAMAAWNAYRAREVEREHPPAGRFITAEGVRLHYLQKGDGRAVVLLHGNVVTAEDFALSGIIDLLAAHQYRAFAFDRPGFGYSDRPLGAAWTPMRQGQLLRNAFAALGIVRPIVIGHSWGTLVAVALALSQPDVVGGLVLVSGYYQPTLRADVPIFSLPAIPIIGDLLRYTVGPPFGAAALPRVVAHMFSPLPVPERFTAGFPHGMAVRPSQIRAEAQDTATMVSAVAAMQHRYSELSMPVIIMAGTNDRVVDYQRHAVRLNHQIPHSTLWIVSEVGHMVHYAAPEKLVAAVEVIDHGQTATEALEAADIA